MKRWQKNWVNLSGQSRSLNDNSGKGHSPSRVTQREGQPFRRCWRWANKMKLNLSFVIRKAFLERVPRDRLRKKNRAADMMERLSLTEENLLKYMERIPIEQIILGEGYVQFVIYPTHNGKQLRIACSGESHIKSNNIFFWVLDVQILR